MLSRTSTIFGLALLAAMFVFSPLMPEVLIALQCRGAEPSCLPRYRALGHLWWSYSVSSRARHWYETGAEAGDPIAMFHLAWAHQQQSNERVIEMLQEIARSGTGKEWSERWFETMERNFDRAPRHRQGAIVDVHVVLDAFESAARDVNEDLQLALSWYGRSAIAGFAPAANNLAVLYYNGVAGMNDRSASGVLFSRAAEAKNPVAIKNFERFDDASAAERHAWWRAENYPLQPTAAEIAEPTLGRTLLLGSPPPGQEMALPLELPGAKHYPLTPSADLPTFDQVRKGLENEHAD